MKRLSLRARLLIAWTIFIAITLQIAGLGLRYLFERSIVERTTKELAADLRQLTRGLELPADGSVKVVRAPTDPQFDIVFGGRYWQISEDSRPILKSISLGQLHLDLPKGFVPTSDVQQIWLVGPDYQRLFAISRTQTYSRASDGAPQTLTFVTAVDAAEIAQDTNKFANDLFASLAILALGLLAGAFVQVTVGLSPLEKLRSNVAAVREGKLPTLPETFPDEVMPLVAETNALLDDREVALRKARERAGNLAHGLNTPLAVMSAKARALRQRGESDVADEIDRQIDSMRRYIDRELARARARGSIKSGEAPVDAVRPLRTLADAIASVPRDTPITWAFDVPDNLLLAVDAHDFNDIAGNLIENAYKWAKSQIHIEGFYHANGVKLIIGDDGPGVPDEHYDRILLRGERADTAIEGSGLGLAIVSDLVDLYGGKLQLGRSRLGGLQVTVQLPARD